jgi:glycerophosphoryl diester phosphodiesterase
VIELRRRPGEFARVGHRGASALAPENTISALELAVDLGCDMLEFDVFELLDGTLVLAHDTRALRRSESELVVLDDALAFCAATLPGIGLQVDVKRRGIERGVVDALRRHGVLERSWVSSFDAASLRRFAELEPDLPRSYTFPRTRWRTRTVGASLPERVPLLLARSRATAITPHYSVASPAAIARAHELGAPVYVWTVDDPNVAEGLVRDGVDGIITNDPRIFATLKT